MPSPPRNSKRKGNSSSRKGGAPAPAASLESKRETYAEVDENPFTLTPEMIETTFVQPEPEEAVCSPIHSKVSGIDSGVFTSRRASKFVIEAHDQSGVRIVKGGDSFFIAIRGASRARARVTDNEDGSYSCEWTPSVSGDYYIAVSLFGVPFKGSPFIARVDGPEPYAPKCEVCLVN